ncbi:o-succinylbenzoate synthase [Antarcticibacterium flavum]|uniref:O-succinylbenzoate synthase n=1 Tax=Antarcticibacterium flavum TaxID=2058175 RepID=A0A5B7X6U8_9FLAO|nr:MULTISPECIES: o-succinylbenzoate synthase [Antarcticibacterium]MCM4159597.1 o-succinylbenzoate synthase [Antarcticibacterium sp. W02-3]QCY70845.1 o-succinylbenzoate synthase [Antarcticibacterium flavum]
MQATYHKYILNFKRPSGTSRGVLNNKETWFLILEQDGRRGIGECGILRSLSIDDRPDYEDKLRWVCDNIDLGENVLWEQLREFPSIQFGVEMAFRSLEASSPFILFPSAFTEGREAIPINGLVWMGKKEYMKQQIEEKISAGFSCIKMKIGAIDFQAELELLKYIRSQFTAEEIELRVDANGAFSPAEALEKLKRLSQFNIHSIEQPIKQGNWAVMADLCENTPIPIALDEELIGITDVTKKVELLQTISPQYLIFKPSLIGGIRGTGEWIDLAAQEKIDWWVTSALESNVGLNAISQWTFTTGNQMPQGLGTGGLYTNNFESPLQVKQGKISYDPKSSWDFNL